MKTWIHIYVYWSCEVRVWRYGALASINGLRLSTIVCAVANAIHWFQIQEFTWFPRKHCHHQSWWTCRANTKVGKDISVPSCWPTNEITLGRHEQNQDGHFDSCSEEQLHNSLNRVFSFSARFIRRVDCTRFPRYAFFYCFLLTGWNPGVGTYWQTPAYWVFTFGGKKVPSETVNKRLSVDRAKLFVVFSSGTPSWSLSLLEYHCIRRNGAFTSVWIPSNVDYRNRKKEKMNDVNLINKIAVFIETLTWRHVSGCVRLRW